MNPFQNAKRIVVKVGSSTLTYDTGLMNFGRIEVLAKVLADLQNSGREVILVSSGAIAVGIAKLGLSQRPKDTPSKQAAAAIGQCQLMAIYDRFFSAYGQTVAQILLMRNILEMPTFKAHVTNAFDKLLEMRAIPIVNENDSVSIAELGPSDNDTLSAIVATIVKADALVLLSDIDGFFDSDPHKNANAKLIPHIEKIDEKIEALAGDPGSERGVGGMATKIEAAKMMFAQNIPMAIINGADPAVLYRLCAGGQAGTSFFATGG